MCCEAKVTGDRKKKKKKNLREKNFEDLMKATKIILSCWIVSNLKIIKKKILKKKFSMKNRIYEMGT